MSRPFARILGGEQEPAGTQQAAEEQQQQQQQQQRTDGIRGWWRLVRRRRRGSDDGVPKTSVVATAQEQEMRSVDSNIVSPNSPVSGQRHASPVSGSNSMGFYAPRTMQPIIERPESTMQRENIGIRGNAIEQPTDPQAVVIDLEAEGLIKPEGKWFWQKDSWRGLQSKLFTVLISGLFLAITLAVYLGLALTRDLRLRQEWHVLLILIILVATMFFCHAFARLCIMATNPGRFQRLSRNFSRIPSVAGPGGYANPREPIRIHSPYNSDDPNLTDPTKSPPPVYGLWRCSVRVNPDQFFWVRRTSAGVPTIPEEREHINRNSRAAPRPPSYASDDGITYALAPHQVRRDPSLQAHSSEVNRMQLL